MLGEDLLIKLKENIEGRVIVRKKDGVYIAASHNGEAIQWIFDFRAILLDAPILRLIAELFWMRYEEQYPFQVGGIESASIPLITAIALKGLERGTPVSSFYIRKSRKPDGLQKIVEGRLSDDPVILVDDLINSGSSFIKQLEILRLHAKICTGIFTIVRFRNLQEYVFLRRNSIELVSLFSLSDFNLRISQNNPPPDTNVFKAQWTSRQSKPNYFYRIPKSSPVIDKQKVYHGSDDGMMSAFWQETGEIAWKYKILGFGTQGKTIFSSPALFNNTLYFGAYDGNFYALDTETGEKKWIYMDADWIGSSPCVAEDLGLVYVGLEYGLFKKKGGIVALDTKTGKKKWEYISMPEYTHGSPAYSKKYNVVAIGSNDGCLYMFRATDGKLLWKLQTKGEIKAAPAFDEKRGYVIFGSFDGYIYIISLKNIGIKFSYKTGANIYSTPAICETHVYISGLDKKLYCINLDTFDVEWDFTASGRIFASPIIEDNFVYIGSNDGRLYEIERVSGKNIGFFQTTERITNKIAYNKTTGRFFLLTYANELYCLEKI